MCLGSARDFVNILSRMRFEHCFNPYSEVCPNFDLPDAPSIRQRNLLNVLEAALACKPSSIWIARDLGYRGGRRTGLALTDEFHLAAHQKLLASEPLKRATHGPLLKESTAGSIWDVLNRLDGPVFLWNVFPLHPHVQGQPQSNRSHTRSEAIECRIFLDWLLTRLSPTRVLAIGRDAQNALASLGVENVPVRHPSYGGKTDFLETMNSEYELNALGSGQMALL